MADPNRDLGKSRPSISIAARRGAWLLAVGLALGGCGAAPAAEALPALASQVQAHLERIAPAARAHARLELRLHVYPLDGAQRHKPVLSLTGLYLPLAKLSWQQ